MSDYNEVIHTDWKGRTDSIRKVFTWLRKQGVRRILKLVVVDNEKLPCSDATIVECLREFDTRYLNWNQEDFYIEVLREAGLYNVKELCLSWSGRNSVLYSWSAGLPSLGKLEVVHIDTKSGVESGETDKQNLISFKDRLQEGVMKLQIDQYRQGMTNLVTDTLRADFHDLGPKLKEAILTSKGQPNYSQLTKVSAIDDPQTIEGNIAKFESRVMRHLKDTKRLREIKVDDATHHNLSNGTGPRHGKQKPKGHRWIDAALKLVTAVNNDRLQNQNVLDDMRPVKVAVVDDGATPGELTIKRALKDGWPPLSTRKRDTTRPYYNSEKGHGTKMARLIQYMCPFVHLYVAKVYIYKEKDSSVATSAAEAIEWAMEKQVDVILMSWTVKRIKEGQGENQKAIETLDTAIQNAARDDIIMICAVEDQGHYGTDDVFPQKSDTSKLMIVGSANENGDKSDYVKETSFDYLFPGEIFIPGMLEESDVGSSVAAAVAAGMGAMILWCAEYHSIATTTKVPEDPKVQETEDRKAYIGATTNSVITTILNPLQTGPRTAAPWDFRRHKRMSKLFDALKPAQDKFMDITDTINQAMKGIDDVSDITAESQK